MNSLVVFCLALVSAANALVVVPRANVRMGAINAEIDKENPKVRS